MRVSRAPSSRASRIAWASASEAAGESSIATRMLRNTAPSFRSSITILDVIEKVTRPIPEFPAA